MVDIHDTTVQFSGDGVTLTAYISAPVTTEKRPAVIIVQEWWGLVEHIKDVARRFAREGYFAIAPDLYSRLDHAVTVDSNEAGALMNRLSQEDGLKDLRSTLLYLQTLPDADAARVAVAGFCMGGFYALMLPCLTGDIKAAVPFYGQVPNPDTPLQNLSCPVLYIYGEEDGWITKSDVHRLEAALKKYKKIGEVKTYPGATHAFFNDTREDVYQPAAAKDAWTRTLAFLKEHLA
ncbi:MAG: Dienelactone hydrolase-like enzyme [Nitrospira sp.]|jgi:carboxymethylenebutenolidase|nr:Dienelactone hydrolase-like enzyme [Nitrospira sp.]